MTPLTCHEICSLDELRATAAAWDDLWWRSTLTLPTARAETLAQAVEFFTPAARFRAVVVERQGRAVAALPLVEGRIARWLPAALSANNPWLGAGDLLLDLHDGGADACDALLAGLGRLPVPLVWLNDAALDDPHWRALAAAAERAGLPLHARGHCRVGRIECNRPWEEVRRGWSRKHRQKMAWCLRRLRALGPLELKLHADFPADRLPAVLQRVFEIEHRSWKGHAGTSVLGTPGMFGFFLAQARRLARWGQLEIAALDLDGRPIAFVLGQTAKGVFHSCKIGYEPELADYSPGQVLRYLMLEQFAADPTRRAVDFQGPLTAAHAAWRPESYRVGRLAMGTGWAGRFALAAYRALAPARRRPRFPA